MPFHHSPAEAAQKHIAARERLESLVARRDTARTPIGRFVLAGCIAVQEEIVARADTRELLANYLQHPPISSPEHE